MSWEVFEERMLTTSGSCINMLEFGNLTSKSSEGAAMFNHGRRISGIN